MRFRLRLLAVGLAVAATLGACRRPDPAQPAGIAGPAVRVELAPVAVVTAPAALATTGTVRAVRRATLAARVAGTVATLPVTLGAAVPAGAVLLTISADETVARVTQTRALLAQVERELDRERRLLASGAGTREVVRTLEDRLAQTRAALAEIETLAAYAVVRAPFAGTIARKHVEVGDFAAPGAPLLQLEGTADFEIEVGLPESAGSALALGTSLAVEIPAVGLAFTAPVAELSSAADPAVRQLLAKLAVPPGTAVRPGQFARVTFPGAPATSLRVPASAVSVHGQMERVFVVGPGPRAELRLVKTGARHGDLIEIAAGLDSADRVIVNPPATLRDGQPVAVAP